jgi:hypothetical protein
MERGVKIIRKENANKMGGNEQSCNMLGEKVLQWFAGNSSTPYIIKSRICG